MNPSFLYIILLAGITTTSSIADILPTLEDKGWSSYHAGFYGSGFEIAVDTRGEIKFYFTPRKKQRLNLNWPVETQIRIERREKGTKKWVKRTTKLDGFTSTSPVKFGQEDIEFEATVTGDVKFKVKITFDKSGINIQSQFANQPEDAGTADYRLVLESSIPSLMTGSSKYEEKELKAKTRGDEIKIGFKKEEEQKIRLYEKQDSEKLNAIFPNSIMLKADKIGRKKLTWSILDKKDKGSFELDFKSSSNRFLDGCNLRCILINEKAETLSKGIRLEYK